MKKSEFDQQVARLFARWPGAFTDQGRIQRLADQYKLTEAAAFEKAVTELLATRNFAPNDSEIAGVVNRFSSRRTPAPGGFNAKRQRCEENLCRGTGLVELFALHKGPLYEPGHSFFLRCCCPLGEQILTEIDGQRVNQFRRELVDGPGARWSLEYQTREMLKQRGLL